MPVQYKTAKHLTQKPNIYSTKAMFGSYKILFKNVIFEKKNIFKCVIAFKKMLPNIYSTKPLNDYPLSLSLSL